MAPRLAAALALGLLLLPACSSRAPRTAYARPDSAEVMQEQRIERKLALENFLERQRRLNAVALPMWTRGSDLCEPRTRFRIWATFATNEKSSPTDRQTWAEVLPLDERPTAAIVAPGSPAEAAGLQVGDVVTAVDGEPLQGKAGIKELSAKAAQSGGQPLRLSYLRGGVPAEAVVVPVKSCDYGIAYVENDDLNSMSDGKQVVIYGGLMRFTDNDSQLAAVLGHELAHNAEHHREAKEHNARNGAIIDAVIGAGGVNTRGTFAARGAMRYSQEFEYEADYVGLYFMARGGYDLEQAPNFWRRFAAEHPRDIRNDIRSSHPSSPQRFTAMEAAIAEIKAKIANGEPLVPELKPIPGRAAPQQTEAPPPG